MTRSALTVLLWIISLGAGQCPGPWPACRAGKRHRFRWTGFSRNGTLHGLAWLRAVRDERRRPVIYNTATGWRI